MDEVQKIFTGIVIVLILIMVFIVATMNVLRSENWVNIPNACQNTSDFIVEDGEKQAIVILECKE